MPEHETTYIVRTEEEDRRFAREVVRQFAEKNELTVESLKQRMRLESGTCYLRDLAWLWDKSKATIKRRLEQAGVQPTSTEGKEHLWDVREANQAIQEA